jgi:hypothetical protein
MLLEGAGGPRFGLSGGRESSAAGCARAFARVTSCWKVGVGVLVELERVLSLADVEFDEFARGVFVDDDGCAVSTAAPEEHDVAAGGVAAGELFRVRVEGEAIAGHHRFRSLGAVGSCSRLDFMASVVRRRATRPGHDSARVSVGFAKGRLSARGRDRSFVYFATPLLGNRRANDPPRRPETLALAISRIPATSLAFFSATLGPSAAG